MPGLVNMENLVAFSDAQFSIIIHVLSIGAAAHFAAIFYFILTMKRSAGRYAPASIMSVVVMVSAGILLYRLAQSFEAAFAWDGTAYVLSDMTYTHGYRYLNWLIDVPLLLVQLLFAFDIATKRLYSLRVQLATAGVLMVVTGYIGQFYESSALSPLLIWGAISTVPFIWLSVIILQLVGRRNELPPQAAITVRNMGLLFAFSWGLYPIAYLVPAYELAFLDGVTANGAVVRTVLFTVADVTAKIVWGVLLGKVLTIRSAAEGYAPAREIYPEVEQLPTAAEPQPVG
jgi:bacteriorhodopsin